MSRDEAPLEKVVILPKLEKYAEEHNLLIDPHYIFKIQWMEEHGGRCFCDWESDRRCPCSHCLDDLIRFNGNCMCSILITPEKLKQKEKQRNRPTWIRITESVAMKNGIIYDLDELKRKKKEKAQIREAEAKQFLQKLKGKKKKRSRVVKTTLFAFMPLRHTFSQLL